MSIWFKIEIKKRLSEICKKMGFKKKQNVFIMPYSENVLAILFFSVDELWEPGNVSVSVSVGVTYKDVEELYHKLCEVDKSLFTHTIWEQIGYLMPEKFYKEWNFLEGSDNTYVYEDILKCIQTYGFDFYDRMKDFNNLLRAFEIRTPCLLNISRDRRLPILYYLNGEKEKGLKVIEEAIARQKQPVDKTPTIKPRGAEVVVIVGSGYGKVDPTYLKFVKKYKAL